MPLNIRLALWLTHFLCPEIGAHHPSLKKPTPRSAPRSKAPDFIPDRDLAAADHAFRRYADEEYELVAEWTEYAARKESTRHHLFR